MFLQNPDVMFPNSSLNHTKEQGKAKRIQNKCNYLWKEVFDLQHGSDRDNLYMLKLLKINDLEFFHSV